MQNDLKEIIRDGTLAPSGENCQPWKFSVKLTADGAVISIFNVPEADQSLYNAEQKGSYVAHGALVENMCISAREHGYESTVEIFPKSAEQNLVSVITLRRGQSRAEPLYQAIAERCTNRKAYTGQKLSAEQKAALIDAARSTGFAELKIVDDAERLRTLGHALAINEKVIFENKKVHDFFYDHVLWKTEDQSKAGGFFIDTLEFLPHQLKGVKLFKNWFILRLLNKLAGVSKMIVKENAEKYAASGTLAVVAVNGKTSKDFVNAGRAMERVWLTATKLGLAVHPNTGILYFTEQITSGNAGAFSTGHIAQIKEAYQTIAKNFGVEGKTLPMLFRIGFADAPTARALRLEPVAEEY